MVYENSDDDDDDDVYTNAAVRLKALKAKKSVRPVHKMVINGISEETDLQDHNINSVTVLNHSPVTSHSPTLYYETTPKTRGATASTLNKNTENSPLITIDLDTPISSPIHAKIDDLTDAQSFNEETDPDVPRGIEDDYMVNVKVRWKSREIERVKLGMNEKFAKIFQYFSLLENVPENQILLTRKDIPINYSDTPSSINLQIIDILEGGIIDTTFANNSNDSEPMCKIKIQSCSSMKNCLTYNLGRNQPFKKLVEYWSKEKNVLLSKIKLFFDGELVSLSDTPTSLDLDDEACFDLQFID